MQGYSSVATVSPLFGLVNLKTKLKKQRKKYTNKETKNTTSAIRKIKGVKIKPRNAPITTKSAHIEVILHFKIMPSISPPFLFFLFYLCL